MPSLLQVKRVTDSYSLEIPETDLLLENGTELETEMRPITQIEGLEWCLEYSPSGYDEKYAGYVSVFMKVTKPIKGRYIFAVKNTPIPPRYVCFAENHGLHHGEHKFVSHDDLRNNGAIQNGKFVITCDVEFEVPIAEFGNKLSINELLLESCPQVTIVIGKDTVTISKAILTSISPVFNAMFSHDTKEARTDSVKIPDFDLYTVQNVRKFCLGLEYHDLTIKEAIEVLKFADKYDIKGLQKYLESFLINNITVDTFCDIVSYAWSYSRDFVKAWCARHFSHHGENIYLTAAFVDLEPTVMASLIKAAYIYTSK